MLAVKWKHFIICCKKFVKKKIKLNLKFKKNDEDEIVITDKIFDTKKSLNSIYDFCYI